MGITGVNKGRILAHRPPWSVLWRSEKGLPKGLAKGLARGTLRNKFGLWCDDFLDGVIGSEPSGSTDTLESKRDTIMMHDQIIFIAKNVEFYFLKETHFFLKKYVFLLWYMMIFLEHTNLQNHLQAINGVHFANIIFWTCLKKSENGTPKANHRADEIWGACQGLANNSPMSHRNVKNV